MHRRVLALFAAFLMALATLVFVAPSQAVEPPSAGDLDRGFGNGGKQTLNFDPGPGVNDDSASAIAVYPDGRYVVAGTAHVGSDEFGIVRYNPDGTRDTGFGTQGNGVVLANNGFFHDRATDVLIQPDGKIVVTGYCFGDDFFTIRLNANGTLDNSFGSGGKAVLDFAGKNDQAHGVHLQGDKIVVTGWATNASEAKEFAAARYLSNGQLDTSYGTAGKVMIAMGTDADGNGSTIQPDGKVVIAGRVLTSPGVYGVGLARLTTTGALDPTFGSGGKVLTSFGPKDETLDSVAMQPNGKLVAVGNAKWGTYFDTAALRLNPDGSRDGSFGTNGQLRISMSLDNDLGHAVLVKPDGKIVLAGGAYDGNAYDFYIARLHSNGTRDIEFGTQGISHIPMSIKNDRAYDVAAQGSKLIAVGYAFDGRSNNWAMARVFDTPGLAGARVHPVSFGRPGRSIKASRLRALIGSANAPRLSSVDLAIQRVDKHLLRKRHKCDWVRSNGRVIRLAATHSNGRFVCSDASWNTVVGTQSWNLRVNGIRPGHYKIRARAVTPYGQLGRESVRTLKVTRG